MNTTHKKHTKQRILDEARQLIAQHGYSAVSLRDIGRAVGFQQSGIYNHFPSKQDILYKLMIDHLKIIYELAQRNQAGIDDVGEKLEAFTRFHVTTHIDYPHDVFIAFMELRSLEPGEQYDNVYAHRKRYESLLRKILEDGVTEGRFKIANISVQSKAILAMLTGITTWYAHEGKLNIEETANTYVKAVLNGIMKT